MGKLAGLAASRIYIVRFGSGPSRDPSKVNGLAVLCLVEDVL